MEDYKGRGSRCKAGVDVSMEFPQITTYIEGKREVGGLTFEFQGVRLDMKLTQKSMTKSPLNRLKFVVEYDDGTADVYERALI